MLEYWGGVSHDYKFPDNVKFQYKTDTDLYEFAKVTMATAIIVIQCNFCNMDPYKLVMVLSKIFIRTCKC